MARSDFRHAVDFVFECEGEFSQDQNDPGGETRFGVSQKSYPHLTIKDITKDQAEQIYLTDYWDRLSCSEMPVAVAFCVFDTAVNMGPVTAIRLLQMALRVKIDGVLGPITMGALYALKGNVSGLIAEFTAQRISRYSTLDNFNIFGLGWIRRAVNCSIQGLKLAHDEMIDKLKESLIRIHENT